MTSVIHLNGKSQIEKTRAPQGPGRGIACMIRYS